MLRCRLEVVGIILSVGLLSVAPLRAGQDQGYRSNPPVVRAPSEAKIAFNAQPADAHSYPTPANGPSSPALGVGVIRNQPPESKPNSRRRSPLLIGLYVSYGVLQGLDAQSTIGGLQSGSAHEGNLLVCPFAGHPAALVGFKLGATAGTIYGIDRMYKSHPRRALITLAAINAGFAFVVARNYHSFPAQ